MNVYKVRRKFFHDLQLYEPGDEIELDELEAFRLQQVGYVGEKVDNRKGTRSLKRAKSTK